jgi:hypothetical protein
LGARKAQAARTCHARTAERDLARRPAAWAPLPRVGYGCAMAVTASQDAAAYLRNFVERYVAAWNGCDTEAMAQLITEDVVWADPALPEPARGVA